jgi:hypothetical protein
LLVLVCVGIIGVVVGIIIQYAVSRRVTGYLPLTRAAGRRVALAAWVPAGLVIAAFGLGIVAAVVGSLSSGTTSHINKALVYTTWVADAKVASGAEPGYKPALTSLTGDHVTSADAAQDSDGKSWDLNLTFDGTGTALLTSLTRDGVAACPGDTSTDQNANCVQRVLAIWIGLTQLDIDNWEVQDYAFEVSQPFGGGCPGSVSIGSPCAKLVTDAITVEVIDTGSVAISGMTQKKAQDMAAAIEVRSSTTSPIGVAIAWTLAGAALLAFLGGIVGALVLRRVIGPRARVMEAPPGYFDRPVELRNLHPAFVAAVLYTQQTRAAQYSSTYGSAYPPANPPLPPGSN